MSRVLPLCVMLVIASVAEAADESRLVNFTVTIASGSSEKLQPDAEPKELAKVVAALDKSGGLASFTQLNFSAIELEQARFQWGESNSVVTGRTVAGGQAAGRGGPGGGGFGGSVSLSREQTGTMIGAIARVVDGAVVAQLEIEQTKRDSRPAPAENDVTLPPGTNILSFKSAVRIPTGETVLLGSFQERSPSDTRKTIVLVSATISEVAKNARADTSEIKIFTLKNANAEESRVLLSHLFADSPVSIAADERTNSLIVRGAKDPLMVFEAVLLRLDESDLANKPVNERRPLQPKPVKERSSSAPNF